MAVNANISVRNKKSRTRGGKRNKIDGNCEEKRKGGRRGGHEKTKGKKQPGPWGRYPIDF